MLSCCVCVGIYDRDGLQDIHFTSRHITSVPVTAVLITLHYSLFRHCRTLVTFVQTLWLCLSNGLCPVMGVDSFGYRAWINWVVFLPCQSFCWTWRVKSEVIVALTVSNVFLDICCYLIRYWKYNFLLSLFWHHGIMPLLLPDWHCFIFTSLVFLQLFL